MYPEAPISIKGIDYRNISVTFVRVGDRFAWRFYFKNKLYSDYTIFDQGQDVHSAARYLVIYVKQFINRLQHENKR